MKTAIVALCAAIATNGLALAHSGWQPSPGHKQIQLWPATAPDAEFGAKVGETAKPSRLGDEVDNVSRPTMTVYSPEAKNTGAAIVVFPGGGYKILAIDLEGTEVCQWANARGITCAVLKYRVPDSGPHWEDSCNCEVKPQAPMALEDAQRAVGLLRFHAAEYHVDPHKIGVLGFSAGGHLVSDISTHFEKRAYMRLDAADQVSCRPDFAVALYPGHEWRQTYGWMKENPDIRPTKKTPPTFIVQAENDPVDSINNSLVYYIALKDAGVRAELHLYAEGGHAFGLRPTKYPITRWPELMMTWLGTIGIIST
jgi:acetyl esterase/lipase